MERKRRFFKHTKTRRSATWGKLRAHEQQTHTLDACNASTRASIVRSNSITSLCAAVEEIAGRLEFKPCVAPAAASVRGVVLLEESAGDAAPLVTEDAIEEREETAWVDTIGSNDEGAADVETAMGGEMTADMDGGGEVCNVNSSARADGATPRAASSLASSSCSDNISRSV